MKKPATIHRLINNTSKLTIWGLCLQQCFTYIFIFFQCLSCRAALSNYFKTFTHFNFVFSSTLHRLKQKSRLPCFFPPSDCKGSCFILASFHLMRSSFWRFFLFPIRIMSMFGHKCLTLRPTFRGCFISYQECPWRNHQWLGRREVTAVIIFLPSCVHNTNSACFPSTLISPHSFQTTWAHTSGNWYLMKAMSSHVLP